MARTVKEWQGRTDGTKAPPRVRQRIFDRDNGTCHLCKLPIKVGETWHLDHIKALINGGENRESNLAPAHAHCHMAKTREDVAEKKKVNRVRQKHTGAVRPKQSIQGRGFAKSEKPKRISKDALPELPRPQLYARMR